MLNNEYYKSIRILGYLLLGYSLLKALGLTTATVLERLHTEYNFAQRNKLINGGYFGIDVTEIANSLALSKNEVINSLNRLIELQLIEIPKVNGINVAYIDQEQIIQFVKDVEKENNYTDWDNGLKSIQYSAYRELDDYFKEEDDDENEIIDD